MYNKHIKMNSNGFTLIEIISAITLLGLVITAILPIFPQIINWNKHANDELIAGNLLGQVAYELKSNSDFYIDLHNTDSSFDLEAYYLNGKHYQPEIIVDQVDEEDMLGLYRTHIQIYSEDAQLLSDTYIYLISEDEAIEEIQ